MADQPIILTHKPAKGADAWALSEDRVLVFSVTRPNLEREEGSDAPEQIVVDYTMPAKPNTGFALKYLKKARDNADEAFVWLIESAIGADGYDALADELSDVDDPAEAASTFQAIAQKIQKIALGGLEAPKA